jgi:TRAP-type transport system small permease protein
MLTLYNWLNKIEKVLVYLSSMTLFLMMLLIVLDVFFRATFNSPIPGTLELTGEYLLVIIVYLSISYTQGKNGHVNVELIQHKFSNTTKKIIKVFSNLLTLFIFSLLGLFNFQQGLDYFANGIKSVSVHSYPLAPALMIITIGLVVFSLRLIIEIVFVFINHKDPQNT